MEQRAFCAVVLLVGLLGTAAGLEFREFFNKRPDPCANDLITTWYQSDPAPPGREFLDPSHRVSNCIMAGLRQRVPVISTTLLLPSSRSIPSGALDGAAGPGQVNPAFLRLSGFGLTDDSEFCLGAPTTDPSRYCVPVPGVTDTRGCALGITNAEIDVIVDTSNTLANVNIPLTGPSATVPQKDAAWNQVGFETEVGPRPICYLDNPVTDARAVWSGFTLGVVNSCTNTTCTTGTATFCCPLARVTPFVFDPTVAGTITEISVRTCIDPNVQDCCGATPINRQLERCCNRNWETVRFIDGNCPCSIGNTTLITRECPVGSQNCCARTRGNFQSGNVILSDRSGSERIGWCFDPDVQRCCNSGELYDPGSMQCCPVNGLQSVNTPCPCNVMGDCPLADNRFLECCRQSAPAPTIVATCPRVANFPGAISPAQAHRCLGACFDVRYQLCCNGALCVQNYEKCCNDTCCNKFAGKCVLGTRQAPSGIRANPLFYGDIFQMCTMVEFLDPVSAFWAYILPTLLFAGVLASLALALVFVNKSSANRFMRIELVLLGIAAAAALLGIPLFYSPLYKYGIIAAVAGFAGVFAAGARLKWLNVFAIILFAVAALYFIDPFFGNSLFTTASGRTDLNDVPTRRMMLDRMGFFEDGIFSLRNWANGVNDIQGRVGGAAVGIQDPATSGVWHSTWHLWINARAIRWERNCVDYYHYFEIDTRLYDFSRESNPEIPTFGFCSRAWAIGLLFIEAVLIILLLLGLILAILALALRFRKVIVEPIELEVVPTGPAF